MNTLTKKQKMVAGISVAILAALYYGPSMILSVRQAIYNREHASEIAAQQEAAQQEALKRKAAEDGAKAQAASVDAAPFPLSAIAGFWQGTASIPGSKDFCTFHVELRENGFEPNHMHAFPSIICMQLGAKPSAGGLLRNLSPTTAILNGAWDTEAVGLRFTVLKSMAPDGACPITALTITPFGTAGLSADWEEGKCKHGTALLQRTNR